MGETIMARPSSSFQALPRTRESLPAKPEPSHKMRHQRNSTWSAYSRSCKSGFFGKSPFHPRYPAKVKADGWDADLSDNAPHHTNILEQCEVLDVNAIARAVGRAGNGVDFPDNIPPRRDTTVSTTDIISLDLVDSGADEVVEMMSSDAATVEITQGIGANISDSDVVTE